MTEIDSFRAYCNERKSRGWTPVIPQWMQSLDSKQLRSLVNALLSDRQPTLPGHINPKDYLPILLRDCEPKHPELTPLIPPKLFSIDREPDCGSSSESEVCEKEYSESDSDSNPEARLNCAWCNCEFETSVMGNVDPEAVSIRQGRYALCADCRKWEESVVDRESKLDKFLLQQYEEDCKKMRELSSNEIFGARTAEPRNKQDWMCVAEIARNPDYWYQRRSIREYWTQIPRCVVCRLRLNFQNREPGVKPRAHCCPRCTRYRKKR
jgi:hypothetical protein